jgi:glycosyltransferase involved in cell wall biosynthesis
MEEPQISVIIPAFNERDFIVEALRSVNGQSYDRLETIVVANACTDDTAKLARAVADYVIEIPRQGVSNAKNRGVEIANGNVYTFMDADSRMKEDLLEKVCFYILNGYSGGKAKIRSLDDDRLRANLFCAYAEALSRATKTFPFVDSGSGSFTFTTEELFDEIKSIYGEGFRTDLQVMEDVDFLTKIKKHGKYKFITDSCLYTSMRRFMDEGYWKCFVKDTEDVLNPIGKTRKRWRVK